MAGCRTPPLHPSPLCIYLGAKQGFAMAQRDSGFERISGTAISRRCGRVGPWPISSRTDSSHQDHRSIGRRRALAFYRSRRKSTSPVMTWSRRLSGHGDGRDDRQVRHTPLPDQGRTQRPHHHESAIWRAREDGGRFIRMAIDSRLGSSRPFSPSTSTAPRPAHRYSAPALSSMPRSPSRRASAGRTWCKGKVLAIVQSRMVHLG